MVNKKRKLSIHDYLDCYCYFDRAIGNNRLEFGNSSVELKAVEEFRKLASCNIIDDDVDEFQSWIDKYTDDETWARCYRSVNQKKYLKKNGNRNVSLSMIAYTQLKDFAAEKELSMSEAISHLLDNYLPPATLTKEPINADSSGVVIPFRPLKQKPQEPIEEELFASFYDPFISPPAKEKKYSLAQDERYQEYRRSLKKLTIKKPNDELISKFDNTFSYYLQEKNIAQVGRDLLSLRDELLKDSWLSRKFNADDFVISKPITMPRYQFEGYGEEALCFLTDFWGCNYTYISSGKQAKPVILGNNYHVQLAYKTFNHLDAYLSEEAEKFVETCHKNTKRQNKYLKAGWHSSTLFFTMLGDALEDDVEFALLDYDEQKNLRHHSFLKVGEFNYDYYDRDESEPWDW